MDRRAKAPFSLRTASRVARAAATWKQSPFQPIFLSENRRWKQPRGQEHHPHLTLHAQSSLYLTPRQPRVPSSRLPAPSQSAQPSRAARQSARCSWRGRRSPAGRSAGRESQWGARRVGGKSSMRAPPFCGRAAPPFCGRWGRGGTEGLSWGRGAGPLLRGRTRDEPFIYPLPQTAQRYVGWLLGLVGWRGCWSDRQRPRDRAVRGLLVQKGPGSLAWCCTKFPLKTVREDL